MSVILGKKIGQSQIFTNDGERIPVTHILVDSCYLVDIKTTDKDGYFALKLGFAQKKRINKSIQGQLKKAGVKAPLSFSKEMRIDKFLLEKKCSIIEESKKKGVLIGEKKFFIGDQIKPDLVFQVGDKVIISGRTKGKGFQGVVKRHGFAGGPKTHGQSDRLRAPGSIGQTTTPGRVFKGKRMAGRMGNKRVTLKNLTVVSVTDKELILKGLVPGPKGSILEIKKN